MNRIVKILKERQKVKIIKKFLKIYLLMRSLGFGILKSIYMAYCQIHLSIDLAKYEKKNPSGYLTFHVPNINGFSEL